MILLTRFGWQNLFFSADTWGLTVCMQWTLTWFFLQHERKYGFLFSFIVAISQIIHSSTVHMQLLPIHCKLSKWLPQSCTFSGISSLSTEYTVCCTNNSFFSLHIYWYAVNCVELCCHLWWHQLSYFFLLKSLFPNFWCCMTQLNYCPPQKN